MNKDILTQLLIELLTDNNKKENTDSFIEIGTPVIVRARDAGVHFGYYQGHEGRDVKLTKSRRMCRWWAKTQMSLSAVAEFGLNLDRELRIQNELPKIEIMDGCEIIPCTKECVESIGKVEPYNEQ